MPIGDTRRAHVRAFDAELKRKKLSPSTRNVVRAVVSRALEAATLDDLILANPVVGARDRGARKAERKRPSFTVWTQSELRQLLAAADGRLAAIWRLAIATGARRGELLGVRWIDVMGEAGEIRFDQQVVATPGGMSISPLKTEKSHRRVRVDAATLAVLEQHRGAQELERALAGDAYEDRDRVFCDELGRPVSPGVLTKAFAELRTAAGIRPGRLHDLRHTAATHLLTAGVPVHIVSARLGHASPTITLNTYAHVLPTSDERAPQVMESVLG